jgi:hypothetical protein
MTSLSDRHVSHALRDLEKVKAIETIRVAGQPSRYRVLPPSSAVVPDLGSTPTEVMTNVVTTPANGVMTHVVTTPLTHVVTTRNRPGNRSINRFNDVARARAQEESEKANDLADAYAARLKETPMDAVRRRMLEHARRRTIEMLDEDMSEDGNATQA